jgi:hypothetical protein
VPRLAYSKREAACGTRSTLAVVSPLATTPPSFGGVHSYRAGRSPDSLAIGDLNVDGKPDLVTANVDADTISVLLDDGRGGYRPRRDYATGRWPAAVAIGDVDGDDVPDLATANTSATTVSVLLNRGDGSFGAKVDYRAGAEPRWAAIGELNGDGNADLAVARQRTGARTTLALPAATDTH